MGLVAENTVAEEEEEVEVSKENESSGRNKPFTYQMVGSNQSAGSEASNLSVPNKNDVTCFLDLLNNSRGSSATEQEEAINRTGGLNDMHAKQDMSDYGQGHSQAF